jgi:MBG domain (YGX type)
MLTIIASSGTTTFGGVPPLIAPFYSEFVNGDAAIKLAPPPTSFTAAISVSIVETYLSSCSGALDSNYNISYVPGTVTVT